MSLRTRALSGMGWTGASQLARQLIHFVVLAILARLLTPADFGLLGMITVFTGFAALLSDAGFGAALIQRADISERHISSVYWLNIGTGALLTVVFIVLAPFIADFFDEPRLQPLATLVGINFIISSVSFVQLALLRRSMNFRLIAAIETVEVIVSGTVAIILALMGFGPWSLAWQVLLGSLTLAIGFTVFGAWRPKLSFHWPSAKELMRFSLNLLGFKSINYWVRNGDNLLIGKFVGPAGLGIYARAYTLMLLPINKVGLVVGRVMFPALAEIQSDRDRVRRVFLRANRIIALATFPMMFGLFAVAEPFVLAVFGPQWTATVPVLQVLSLVGVNQSIGTTMGWIYQSQGRTDWQFRWGLVAGPLTIAAFAFGVRWGVMGVAWAYLIRTYVAWYPSVSIPGRLVQMSVKMYFKNLLPVWWRSIAMAWVVWMAQVLFLDSLAHWIQLVILIPGGALIYFALINIGKVEAYEEFRGVVTEVIHRRRNRRRLKSVPA